MKAVVADVQARTVTRAFASSSPRRVTRPAVARPCPSASTNGTFDQMCLVDSLLETPLPFGCRGAHKVWGQPSVWRCRQRSVRGRVVTSTSNRCEPAQQLIAAVRVVRSFAR